jgi:hypothetical protein
MPVSSFVAVWASWILVLVGTTWMTRPSALAIAPAGLVTLFSLPTEMESSPGITTGAPGFGIGRSSAGWLATVSTMWPTSTSVVAW